MPLLASAHRGRRRILSYIGLALLLLIIPVKLIRYGSAAGQVLVGVAPSLLGPSGLLFIVSSSRGRLSQLTVARLAILVGAASVGLELAQLLPRPGILARVHYTFDVLDLIATVASVSIAALVAGVVLRGSGRDIAFQPLTEADLPLLLEWLNRPHLQEWWRSDETSLEEVREKYLPRIAGHDAARPFIAYVAGRPIGYIQYYLACEGSPGWWPDEPGPGVVGIDQFLADGDALGQGVGTAMVSRFVEFLLEKPHVTEIRVDPRPDNRRAIRCYAKVGFQEKGPITTPDGPAIMMTLTRKVGSRNAV